MPDLKMTTTELNGQKAVLNIQEINAAKRAARALISIQEVKYTTGYKGTKFICTYVTLQWHKVAL